MPPAAPLLYLVARVDQEGLVAPFVLVLLAHPAHLVVLCWVWREAQRVLEDLGDPAAQEVPEAYSAGRAATSWSLHCRGVDQSRMQPLALPAHA